MAKNKDKLQRNLLELTEYTHMLRITRTFMHSRSRVGPPPTVPPNIIIDFLSLLLLVVLHPPVCIQISLYFITMTAQKYMIIIFSSFLSSVKAFILVISVCVCLCLCSMRPWGRSMRSFPLWRRSLWPAALACRDWGPNWGESHTLPTHTRSKSPYI